MGKGEPAIEKFLRGTLMELREKVINQLRGVIDPETLTDVVSMGVIKNLEVTEDGNETLDFEPSSPVCPLAIPLVLKIQYALKDLQGVAAISIKVIGHKLADEINNYLEEECSYAHL